MKTTMLRSGSGREFELSWDEGKVWVNSDQGSVGRYNPVSGLEITLDTRAKEATGLTVVKCGPGGFDVFVLGMKTLYDIDIPKNLP